MNIEDIQKLRKSQHIEFSAISGYNYYYLPEYQPVDGSIYALHAQADTVVSLIPIGGRRTTVPTQEEARYTRVVLKSMPSPGFEWPIDLLVCKAVDGTYMMFYAFAKRAFPDFVPLKKLLYQRRDSKVLDWRKQQIRQVCTGFLTAMKQLDESEYNYNDFNIERILYQESTGKVVLRHTPHLRNREEEDPSDILVAEEIAPEFAPPCLFGENFDGVLPPQGDYYSVAAILFKLMIGRLPYEGRGLSNYGYVFDPVRDVDERNHNNYFVQYHKFPHFIFDTKDESNRIAPMQENDLVRERWETLPEEIKKMFQNALCGSTAERLTKNKLYSPAQWLEACNRYCWNASNFGGE